jgi:hypothetical protein
VGTYGGWGGDRLGGVVIAPLHLVKFTHQLRALSQGLMHHEAFADEASPKEGD